MLLLFDTFVIFALHQCYWSCSSSMLLVLLFLNAIGPTPQQRSSLILLFPLVIFNIILVPILGIFLLHLDVVVFFFIALACPILD